MLRASLLATLFTSVASAQAPGGWPLHSHDLGGQRFSALRAIDTSTVANLAPRWTYHSGVTATFQATPIGGGGVMFVSVPFSGVVALDAKTGAIGWDVTVAEYAGTTEATSQLKQDDPFSRVRLFTPPPWAGTGCSASPRATWWWPSHSPTDAGNAPCGPHGPLAKLDCVEHSLTRIRGTICLPRQRGSCWTA